jgi:hypothetical protein
VFVVRYELGCVSPKKAFFIVTTMKTSTLTYYLTLHDILQKYYKIFKYIGNVHRRNCPALSYTVVTVVRRMPSEIVFDWAHARHLAAMTELHGESEASCNPQ